ncbi:UNVERIFIED_CONTAM: hypothetical protein GPA08_14255 [Serratia marcescens]
MKLEKLTVNSRLTEQEIKSNKEVSNEGYFFVCVCVLSICFSVAHSAPYTIKVKSDTRYGDSLIIESWDVNDSTTNPMTYQPKGSDNLRFIHYSISESGYSPGAIFVPGARKAKTMGELGRLFISAGYLGKEFSGYRFTTPGHKSCWKFGYEITLSGGIGSSIPFDTTCTYGELPQTTCWIDKPSIEIDHGILAAREVNGNSVYTDFYVSCSSTMPVYVVSTTGKSSVVLSQENGLRSDIMVNDNKLGDGARITASTSPTRVRISSTLAGYTESNTGSFSGSLTIIIAPVG